LIILINAVPVLGMELVQEKKPIIIIKNDDKTYSLPAEFLKEGESLKAALKTGEYEWDLTQEKFSADTMQLFVDLAHNLYTMQSAPSLTKLAATKLASLITSQGLIETRLTEARKKEPTDEEIATENDLLQKYSALSKEYKPLEEEYRTSVVDKTWTEETRSAKKQTLDSLKQRMDAIKQQKNELRPEVMNLEKQYDQATADYTQEKEQAEKRAAEINQNEQNASNAIRKLRKLSLKELQAIDWISLNRLMTYLSFDISALCKALFVTILELFEEQRGNAVTSVVFSNDDTMALTSGQQVSVIWDTTKDESQQISLLEHWSDVPPNSSAFNSEGTKVIIDVNKKAQIWEIKKDKPLLLFTLQSQQSQNTITQGKQPQSGIELRSTNVGRLIAVAFVRGGANAITASWDGTLKLWDLTKAQPSIVFNQTFQGANGQIIAINGAALSNDGTKLITISGSAISIFDMTKDSPKLLWTFEENSTQRGLATFKQTSFNNLAPVGLNRDGTKAVASLKETDYSKAGPKITQNNQIVITQPENIAYRFPVKIWDVSQDKPQVLRELPHDEYANAIAISDDGRIVITGSSKTLKIWDATTGESLATIYPKGGVNSVAINHASTRIILGTQANAQIWEIWATADVSILQIGLMLMLKAATKENTKITVDMTKQPALYKAYKLLPEYVQKEYKDKINIVESMEVVE